MDRHRNGATARPCNPDTHFCQSLRAAIAASEATKEVPDTINVPAGTININNDLVIQSDITVIGASARDDIIDGGAKYRGFRITASGNAKISHFTVRDGAAGQGDSPDGGGILNFSGVVAARPRARDRQPRAGGHRRRDRELPGHAVAASRPGRQQHGRRDGAGIANIGGAETPTTLLGVGDSTCSQHGRDRRDRRHHSRGGQANIVAARPLDARRQHRRRARRRRPLAGQQRRGAGRSASDRAQHVAGDGDRQLRPAEADRQRRQRRGRQGLRFDVRRRADARSRDRLRNEGGELDVLPIAAASPAVDRVHRELHGGTPTPAAWRGRRARRATPARSSSTRRATVTITSGRPGRSARPTSSSRSPRPSPASATSASSTGPGQTPRLRRVLQARAAYAGLANGSYTFSVRAMDGAFPNPPVDHAPFTVAALDTTITGGPTDPTNDTTPTFTFTGSTAAELPVPRRRRAVRACPSPHTTALAQGSHTFQVRAPDAAGAPDPTPARRRAWSTPSRPTRRSQPARPAGGSTSATFTFTSTEAGSTFQCSLDGAAFGACPAATPASRRARTRSRSAPPTPRATPTRRPPRNLDRRHRSRPTRTITDRPDRTRHSTSATFTFNSTEAGVDVPVLARRRRLRRLPRRYTGLPQGPHTFQVRAIDAAGNTDETPGHRTVDRRHGRARHDDHRGPTGADQQHQRDVHVQLDRGRRDVRVLARRRRVRRLPGGYTGLAQGAHTFAVRAVDPAGNVDATPATRRGRRHGRARHDDHSRPERPGEQHRAASRSARPRPARRSSARSTAPRSPPARAGYTGARQARTRSRCARPTPRATPTDAGGADLDRRHVAPDTTITGPTGPSNDTTPTSRSARPRPARRSSAASTAARSRLHLAAHDRGAARGRAHLRGARDRRRRQRRGHAGARRPSRSTPSRRTRRSSRAPNADQRSDADVHVHLRGRPTSRAASTAPRTRRLVGTSADGRRRATERHTYSVAPSTRRATSTTPAAAADVHVDTAPLPARRSPADRTGPSTTASPQFTFTRRAGRDVRVRARRAATSTACTSPKHATAGLAEGSTRSACARSTPPATAGDTATRGSPSTSTPPAAAGRRLRPGRRDTNPSPASVHADAGTTVECRLDGPGGAGQLRAVRVAAELQRPGAGRLRVHRALDRRGGQPADELALVHGHDAARRPTPTPTPTPTRRPSRRRSRSRPSWSSPRAARCW